MLAVMNATSQALPRGVDEFVHAGVEKAECAMIDCPYVAQAPAVLECRMTQVVQLLGGAVMVIGEVVGIRLRDDCMVNGRFDLSVVRPAARLGYRDYAVITAPFELTRPDD
jgi:flavin reductase (DIM6/NTAB) family NADH-FMN oxidoreductase RutF